MLKQASGSECAATSRQKDSGTAGVFIILNRQNATGGALHRGIQEICHKKRRRPFQTVSSCLSGIAGVCFTA